MYEEENIEPDFLKRPKTNPFKTPDHYFESMEDRIMAGIKQAENPKTKSAKIIQLLKPVLGLAASFALVALLVYYPINYLMLKTASKTEIVQSSSTDAFDSYSLNIGSIDDNTLADVIFSDETSNDSLTNPDELLAYLSSGMNDIEIYSEIQN
jgi:hypothetical protein